MTKTIESKRVKKSHACGENCITGCKRSAASGMDAPLKPEPRSGDIIDDAAPHGAQRGKDFATVSYARSSLAYGYAILTPAVFSDFLKLTTLGSCPMSST